jgi:hypothetical protein
MNMSSYLFHIISCSNINDDLLDISQLSRDVERACERYENSLVVVGGVHRFAALDAVGEAILGLFQLTERGGQVGEFLGGDERKR